jgi:hypothetical protein
MRIAPAVSHLFARSFAQDCSGAGLQLTQRSRECEFVSHLPINTTVNNNKAQLREAFMTTTDEPVAMQGSMELGE